MIPADARHLAFRGAGGNVKDHSLCQAPTHLRRRSSRQADHRRRTCPPNTLMETSLERPTLTATGHAPATLEYPNPVPLLRPSKSDANPINKISTSIFCDSPRQGGRHPGGFCRATSSAVHSPRIVVQLARRMMATRRLNPEDRRLKSFDPKYMRPRRADGIRPAFLGTCMRISTIGSVRSASRISRHDPLQPG